jgi:hypothetical protein
VRSLLLLAAAAIPALAQLRPSPAAAPTAPVAVRTSVKSAVPLQVLSDLQRGFDERLQAVGTDSNAVFLLTNTCGVYISGYGAVFTTQVDLINTPRITPFQQSVNWAQVHSRKIANVPLLRQAIRELWMAAAAKLTSVPENEQIVIAVRVLYGPAEDTRGLPGQMVMKAERRALLSGAPELEEQ